jgi:cell division protein FtsI/penicillin-binding protein 2
MYARGNPSERRVDRRLTIVAAFFLLVFVGLVARLVKVQIVDHEHHRATAKRMHWRREVLQPERGRIFDRNGALLAFSTENPSIYARREEVQDVRAAATALTAIGLPREYSVTRLTSTPRGFAWLSRALHRQDRVAEIVEEIPGLYAEPEPKRVHPRGRTARRVLGGWTFDPHQATGLEAHFDGLLAGEAGWETVIVDATGNRYATAEGRPPRPGKDLALSIDVRVQEICEAAIEEATARWNARAGAIVLVEPSTGDVLAMASAGAADAGGSALPRAITDPFEVGSCAKLVVAAAALDADVCDTSTVVYCGTRPGEPDPPQVTDAHGRPEPLSMQLVIAQSRNTGTARIARLVGGERLHDYLGRFGFGRRTGINLPGESPGLLRPLESWSGRSLEALAIGYEFSATPLQLCMAYAAVANDGVLMQPRLVREIHDNATGSRQVIEPAAVRRVVKPETARTLRAILRRAVQRGGTGEHAALEWADVAGKTGTTRKLDPIVRRYTGERHLSSFVGMVPADRPRYVCAIVIDEPHGAYYGAYVAAPVFKDVMEKIAAVAPVGVRRDARTLWCQRLPETRPERPDVPSPQLAGVPDLRGLATLTARRLAARFGYRTEVLGSGDRILNQTPPPGERAAEVLVLSTSAAADAVAVPDLSGLGLRRAVATLGRHGLDARRVGEGVVMSQAPEAGTLVPPGAVVEIVLRDPERKWGLREPS